MTQLIDKAHLPGKMNNIRIMSLCYRANDESLFTSKNAKNGKTQYDCVSAVVVISRYILDDFWCP